MPDISACATACAPAKRQYTIQPFANRRATPIKAPKSATILMPQSCRSGEAGFLHALGAQIFGHDKSQLQRLACIEPLIAMGVVAVGEVFFGYRLRSAQAFGD